MTVAYQRLQAVRINRKFQALQDVRQVPGNLLFLNRTPLVNAVDSEIMLRISGQVLMADLISDDAQAVTYGSEKMQYVSTTIPNIKLGRNLTQSQINQLLALDANGDGLGLSDWENRTLASLLSGVRLRMEALCVAMWTDAFSYNRLGIVMSGVTWGMPSDLKATAGTGWDTAASATPVTDLMTLKLLAQVKYGIMYNRVTMSTTAFQYMIATTEFQNKARMYLAPNVSYTNLNLADLTMQKAIAQNVLGMTVELYDQQAWTQNADGTISSAPLLPVTKVVLSDSGNDNNPEAMDFANAIVTESVVSELANNPVTGSLGGPQYGPVAYPTVPPTLNPPSVTYWGVSRGWPRKHLLQATAVLTVGSFSNLIGTVGEPF